MNYTAIIQKNIKLIAIAVLAAVCIGVVFSVLQPFRYSATTRVLVIQKQVANLDAYTANKSAERIAKNISEIIYTSSFYADVINSNMNLKGEFPDNENDRRKAWEKTVSTSLFPETGIIEITAYHTNKAYAAQIATSIAYVIVNKGAQYHGGGDSVEAKIVDAVLISKYPVKPNIPLAAILSALAGAITAIVYVLIRSAHARDAAAPANTPEIPTVSDGALDETLTDQSDDDKGFVIKQEIADESVPSVIASPIIPIRTYHDDMALLVMKEG